MDKLLKCLSEMIKEERDHYWEETPAKGSYSQDYNKRS